MAFCMLVQSGEHAVTRILIAASNAATRERLAELTNSASGLLLAASADNKDDAIQLAAEHQPTVALIASDIGLEVDRPFIADFQQQFPTIPVIAMTANESDDELFAAIQAKASAYLLLDVEPEVLLNTIDRALRGEHVINELLLDRPRIAARCLEQFRQSSQQTDSRASLTDREMEVLQMLREGKSSQHIGYALGISAQTVKNYVNSILRKLASDSEDDGMAGIGAPVLPRR
jgi:DNA-binding NarL/FixJ family response regulator